MRVDAEQAAQSAKPHQNCSCSDLKRENSRSQKYKRALKSTECEIKLHDGDNRRKQEAEKADRAAFDVKSYDGERERDHLRQAQSLHVAEIIDVHLEA